MGFSGQNYSNSRMTPQTGQLVGTQNTNRYMMPVNANNGMSNQLASLASNQQQILPQSLSKPVTSNTMLQQGKSGGKGGGM